MQSPKPECLHPSCETTFDRNKEPIKAEIDANQYYEKKNLSNAMVSRSLSTSSLGDIAKKGNYREAFQSRMELKLETIREEAAKQDKVPFSANCAISFTNPLFGSITKLKQ